KLCARLLGALFNSQVGSKMQSQQRKGSTPSYMWRLCGRYVRYLSHLVIYRVQSFLTTTRPQHVLMLLASFIVVFSGAVLVASSHSAASQIDPLGVEEKVDGNFHLLSFIRGESVPSVQPIEEEVKVRSGDTFG